MRITVHTPRVLYLRQVDDINEVLQRLVAVPALVEAEGPVWGHERPAYDLCVLLDHCLGLGSKEEVAVEYT